VILKQNEGNVEVSIQDPEVMFNVVDDETKKSMAGFPKEVKRSLQFVLEAVQKN